MMSMVNRFGLGLACAIVIAASPALAATVCVHKTKASCSATIQAGINAAAAGDTVKVASGVYLENVTITAKNGLILTGGSGAILDGDDPNTGAVLTVDSADVVVIGITIRNGQNAGIVITLNGMGTVVSRVSITGPERDCINNVAASVTLRSNKLNGCGNNAIDSSGADLDVIGNKISHCDGSCLSLSGAGILVQKNRIRISTDSQLIEITGNNAEVISNKIENAESEGILLSGNDSWSRETRSATLRAESPCLARTRSCGRTRSPTAVSAPEST